MYDETLKADTDSQHEHKTTDICYRAENINTQNVQRTKKEEKKKIKNVHTDKIDCREHVKYASPTHAHKHTRGQQVNNNNKPPPQKTPFIGLSH